MNDTDHGAAGGRVRRARWLRFDFARSAMPPMTFVLFVTIGCSAPGPTLSAAAAASPPIAEPGAHVDPLEPPVYAFGPPELVQRIRVMVAQVALLKEIPPVANAGGVRRALLLLASAMTDLPVPSPAARSAAALIENAVGDDVRLTDERELQVRIKRALQYAAGGLVVTAQGPYERFPSVLVAARRFQAAAERIDPSSQPDAHREQVIAALQSAVAVLQSIAAPA